MARPTSDSLSAGASLVPSPVTATTSPSSRSMLTSVCLSVGEDRASTCTRTHRHLSATPMLRYCSSRSHAGCVHGSLQTHPVATNTGSSEHWERGKACLHLADALLHLLARHLAEVGALHGKAGVVEDAALACDVLRRVDVVPRHHAHHDARALARRHRARHLLAHGVLDAHDAAHGEITVGRRVEKVRRPRGVHLGKVRVAQHLHTRHSLAWSLEC